MKKILSLAISTIVVTSIFTTSIFAETAKKSKELATPQEVEDLMTYSYLDKYLGDNILYNIKNERPLNYSEYNALVNAQYKKNVRDAERYINRGILTEEEGQKKIDSFKIKTYSNYLQEDNNLIEILYKDRYMNSSMVNSIYQTQQINGILSSVQYNALYNAQYEFLYNSLDRAVKAKKITKVKMQELLSNFTTLDYEKIEYNPFENSLQLANLVHDNYLSVNMANNIYKNIKHEIPLTNSQNLRLREAQEKNLKKDLKIQVEKGLIDKEISDKVYNEYIENYKTLDMNTMAYMNNLTLSELVNKNYLSTIMANSISNATAEYSSLSSQQHLELYNAQFNLYYDTLKDIQPITKLTNEDLAILLEKYTNKGMKNGNYTFSPKLTLLVKNGYIDSDNATSIYLKEISNTPLSLRETSNLSDAMVKIIKDDLEDEVVDGNLTVNDMNIALLNLKKENVSDLPNVKSKLLYSDMDQYITELVVGDYLDFETAYTINSYIKRGAKIEDDYMEKLNEARISLLSDLIEKEIKNGSMTVESADKVLATYREYIFNYSYLNNSDFLVQSLLDDNLIDESLANEIFFQQMHGIPLTNIQKGYLNSGKLIQLTKAMEKEVSSGNITEKSAKEYINKMSQKNYINPYGFHIKSKDDMLVSLFGYEYITANFANIVDNLTTLGYKPAEDQLNTLYVARYNQLTSELTTMYLTENINKATADEYIESTMEKNIVLPNSFIYVLENVEF
ncbi:MAG: hypothetical protein ACK5LT_12110 [Lachnospirales bacterium]